jgi:hypothetical protein
MDDDNEKAPTGDYKVGYGKPPKHTQFRARSAEQEPGKAASSRRKRANKKRGAIDVSAVLNERISVTKGGTAREMSPFEVALRAQVKKALTEQNLAAIRNIVALAVEYGLLAPPPAAQAGGGVLPIPKTFSEDEQRAIFDTLEPSENLLNMALRINHAKRR